MNYLFGEFELNVDRFQLLRGGEPCPTEPLVFDLLRFLCENAGRVVSRDEIVEHVWNGRAVSDATVSSCIKAARRVLGSKGGGSETYIRTVRARGFEFTGKLLDIAGREAVHAGGAPANLPAPQPVVAVLPFVNLSPDVKEYFADGLTENLITNLARFRDLRVIGGASAFHFKGRAVDLAELRSKLGAAFLVQGSVRHDGGRVRISAQLIDSTSGIQLWGDRYDRELPDVLALEDEVARTIAAALGGKVQGEALQQALRKKPAELDAYDCMLRARRYTWMLNAEMHAEARDLLERAEELDPLSADVHALLANIYLAEYRFDTNPEPNSIGRALVHALAATRLDPGNAYARAWLAIVYFFRHENGRFDSEMQLALELNPNDPEILAEAGHYYAFMGDFARGGEYSRQAQLLNPLHPGWYHFSFVRNHYHREDYEEALDALQKIGMPNFYWAQFLTTATKGKLGHADAPSALARIFELKPDFSARCELQKWNAAPADLEHIMQGMRMAGLRE